MKEISSVACSYRMRKSLTERFWAKVSKSDGCWEWTAGKRGNGYGSIGVGGKARSEGAHRISWVLHNGPIPLGMNVLHRCDNRGCVNPAHLFLGSHADNMADMRRKERHRHGVQHGSAHHHAKLTEADVRLIREMRIAGFTQKMIAKSLGVDQSNVSLILTGRAWKHIGVLS